MVSLLKRVRDLAGWLLLSLIVAAPKPAFGQAPEPPAISPTAGEEKIAEAKELFRKGVAFFEADDLERALDFFMRSRSAFPSIQNISNAAICLDKLQRYDEALELYELVLTDFKAELTDRERASLGPDMAKLRAKVGNIWVSANVDGSVVVDGRARSSLPLTIAIRALPGAHIVRVFADGYATFETTVEVVATQTARIEAKLEPLRDAGLLRIQDRAAPGSDVYVDGTKMGQSPWEGTLGPGSHVVWTVKGERGSAPKTVVVVQGQKATVDVTSGPLGASSQITVKPETASIAIEGATVGIGSWRGRLPQGSYSVRAFEEGYHAKREQVNIDHRQHPRPIRFELLVDDAHPRWPKAAEGSLFVEAAAGYLLGATLGSGAEKNCSSCPSAPLVHGLSVSAHGGYRFAPGVSLELAVGYIRLQSRFERTVAGGAEAPYEDLSYALSDELLVHGPFGGFGVGYRVPFADDFAFSARVLGGAMLASASDTIEATATTNGQTTNISVSDERPVSRVGTIFVQGDVGLAVVVGPFDIGLTIAAQVFVLDGPTLDQRRLNVRYGCDNRGPVAVGCIESGVPLEDEVAHSTFFLGSPQLRLGYSF